MNRLRELRMQAGYNQTEFGRMFRASQNTISNWENGNRRIDNDRLAEFAAFFDVSIDYLLGRTEMKNFTQNEKPTVMDDGQRVNILVDLSPEELQRVVDFVAGIKAARPKDASRQE